MTENMAGTRTDYRPTGTQNLTREDPAAEDLTRQDRARTDEPDDAWAPEAERESQTGLGEARSDREYTDDRTGTDPTDAERHDAPGRPAQHDHVELTELFDGDEAQRLRSQWVELQAKFVDDPAVAVQEADQLVAEVMQTMAAAFAEHKRELESQWQRDGSADTEDLRQALRHYRAFFDQLLRT